MYENIALRRCLTAAVLAVMICCPIEGADAQETGAQQTYSDNSAKPTDFEWQYKDGDPQSYQAICDKPASHDDANLCQQWRSAQSAEKQLVWVKWQFIASVIGIGGLIATILVSFWTAFEGRRSASAAVQAAKAAQRDTEINILLQMPALIQRGCTVGSGNDNTRTIHFENVGKGRADILRHCLCVFIEDKSIEVELPDTPPYWDDSVAFYDPPRPVNEGDTHELRRNAYMGTEEARDILDGKKTLWVFGFIHYLDFLRRENELGFCLRAVPQFSGALRNMYITGKPDVWTFQTDGSERYRYQRIVELPSGMEKRPWWAIWRKRV